MTREDLEYVPHSEMNGEAREAYNCSDVSSDGEVVIVDDVKVSDLKVRATIPAKFNTIKLGATFSFSNGPAKLFDDVETAGATAFQIFISEPDNWPALYLPAKLVEEFRYEMTMRRWSNENIFVHGHLHVNLASSVEATYNRCYKLFVSEVRACEQLGLKYYIFHPGSPQKKTSREHAIKQMAVAIDRCSAELCPLCYDPHREYGRPRRRMWLQF